jgi:hypothetical protein
MSCAEATLSAAASVNHLVKTLETEGVLGSETFVLRSRAFSAARSAASQASSAQHAAEEAQGAAEMFAEAETEDKRAQLVNATGACCSRATAHASRCRMYVKAAYFAGDFLRCEPIAFSAHTAFFLSVTLATEELAQNIISGCFVSANAAWTRAKASEERVEALVLALELALRQVEEQLHVQMEAAIRVQVQADKKKKSKGFLKKLKGKKPSKKTVEEQQEAVKEEKRLRQNVQVARSSLDKAISAKDKVSSCVDAIRGAIKPLSNLLAVNPNTSHDSASVVISCSLSETAESQCMIAVEDAREALCGAGSRIIMFGLLPLDDNTSAASSIALASALAFRAVGKLNDQVSFACRPHLAFLFHSNCDEGAVYRQARAFSDIQVARSIRVSRFESEKANKP